MNICCIKEVSVISIYNLKRFFMEDRMKYSINISWVMGHVFEKINKIPALYQKTKQILLK